MPEAQYMLTRVIGMPCNLSGSPSASPASCDITVPTHAASICFGSTPASAIASNAASQISCSALDSYNSPKRVQPTPITATLFLKSPDIISSTRAPAHRRTGAPAHQLLLDDSQRINLSEMLFQPPRPLLGRHEPVGRAHGEDLDKGEALSLELTAKRVVQILARELDRRGRVDRSARHVGGAVELRDQLGDANGVAMQLAGPAAGRGLGVLSEHRSRGGLATRFAERPLVRHRCGEALAPRRAVNDFLQAFRHHVAVALHREHEGVGPHALGAGGDRGGAPVQRLHDVDVHDHREGRVAADARDTDRAVAQAELLDELQHETQRDRLAAAGAERVLGLEQQLRLVEHLLHIGRGFERLGHERSFYSAAGSPGPSAGWRSAAPPGGRGYTSRIRARMFSTVSAGPTPNPE